MQYKANQLPMLFSCPGGYDAPEDKSPLPPELQNHGQPMTFFDIPTEFYITKACICTPRQGRRWTVDLYSDNGEFLSFHTMASRSTYDNRVLHPQAHLIEDWQNEGSDGHTDFRLVGYALVAVIDTASLEPWCNRNLWDAIIRSLHV